MAGKKQYSLCLSYAFFFHDKLSQCSTGKQISIQLAFVRSKLCNLIGSVLQHFTYLTEKIV
jgi:hypothetical protein